MYIQFKGTRGTNMSVNAYLIILQTYVQGKTINNQFFIYRPECDKSTYLGAFNDQTGPILLSSYTLYEYASLCERGDIKTTEP